MKKLIAISVVFALVAGTAFAVDLGGAVIGTVNFLESSNEKDGNKESYPLGASAGLNRVRLEGSGENDDGTFGAWLRVDGVHWSGDPQFEGFAWWKPLDLLKIGIGGNSDGMYAKEGVTAWGFYQTASDTGVVNPNHAWDPKGSYYSNGYYGANGWNGFDFGFQYRDAFYGGFGAQALHLTVSPADIVDINIAVPFFIGSDADYDAGSNPGGRASYIFQRTHAQVDLKMDFGNIALTYVGDGNDFDNGNPGKIFAYFGLTSIENLGIDVGIGFPFPLSKTDDTSGKDVKYTRVSPISAGLGAKFTSGSFGVKLRLAAAFAGSSKSDIEGSDPVKDPLKLLADILPFFAVNDNLRIFFSAGLGITGGYETTVTTPVGSVKVDVDPVVGFHINPYVEVGQEWGPKFIAGLQIWSAGIEGSANDGDKALVKWAVPLALHIGF